MIQKTIKVLVVDDSAVFRQMIVNGLSAQPGIEVIGYAVNAHDAASKIPRMKPDVITLDVEMPGLNGIDFLKQLLPQYPVPVILVSSLNLNVFDALSAGAVDFVPKPPAGTKEEFLKTLQNKVRNASVAKVRIPSSVRTSSPAVSVCSTKLPFNSLSSTIIGIGASTGGTEATLSVLKKLPASMPGIVITQHMPEGFTAMYAERLNRLCALEVKEAQNGDEIRPGRALIAPGSLQMEVVHTPRGYAVRCYPGERVNGHRPSVDVLFSSIANNVSVKKVGIIMTGMGRDGAEGLLQMRKKGAFTIGQDKESCVVYGMPMVAYNIGAVCKQASCESIASVLLNYLKN